MFIHPIFTVFYIFTTIFSLKNLVLAAAPDKPRCFPYSNIPTYYTYLLNDLTVLYFLNIEPPIYEPPYLLYLYMVNSSICRLIYCLTYSIVCIWYLLFCSIFFSFSLPTYLSSLQLQTCCISQIITNFPRFFIYSIFYFFYRRFVYIYINNFL